jgi:hypothetical protein
MIRASAQIAAVARKSGSGGGDTYDSLLTAAAWHRLLFKEPPTSGWQYDTDDDDYGDEVAA